MIRKPPVNFTNTDADLKGEGMFKKVLSAVFICFIGLCILYYIASSVFRVHNRIAPDEVQALSINAITFVAETDHEEIAAFVKLFNDAKVLKKSVDTTPAYLIEIKLKNGKKIDIQGTSQGFHYVDDGEKQYKISSIEMSYYLESVIK